MILIVAVGQVGAAARWVLTALDNDTSIHEAATLATPDQHSCGT
jgi:hypothetical protein